MEEYISTTEAAKKLGVSPQTVRNWIRLGYLPAYRFNPKRGNLFIAVPDIEKMTSSSYTGGKEGVGG